MKLLFGFFLFLLVPALPVQAQDSLDFKLAEYLDAHMQNESFMGNVLVRTGDEIRIVSTGFSSLEDSTRHQDETQFRYASLSKPFTATLAFILHQKDMLDVYAPLSTWMPDYPIAESITFDQLLSHTSGIPNFTSFPDYMETMHLPVTVDELLNRFKNKPLDFEPGTRYNYSNSGYVLVSAIIEQVTGLPFADALDRYLLEPLDIQTAGYERPGRVHHQLANGYSYESSFQKASEIHMSIPLGAGGIKGDVRAVLRLVDCVLDDSYITPASRDSMLTPVLQQYGLGWSVGPVLDKPAFGHAGGINGFATNLLHFTEENTTIVILSNLDTASIGPITRDIASIVFDLPYELPVTQAAIELPAETLEKLIGEYELAPGFTISISVEGERIFAQATGQPKFEIFPESETTFFLRVVDARLIFETDEDGYATSLTLLQAGQTVPGHKIN